MDTSQPSVRTGIAAVLARAATDSTFSDELERDPAAATKNFDLTPIELLALKNLDFPRLKTSLAQFGVSTHSSNHTSNANN